MTDARRTDDPTDHAPYPGLARAASDGLSGPFAWSGDTSRADLDAARVATAERFGVSDAALAAALRGEVYPLDGEVYARAIGALLHLERRGALAPDVVARAIAAGLPWQVGALGRHLLQALSRHPAPAIAEAAIAGLVMAGKH